MIKRIDKIDKLIFANLAKARRPLSIMQIVQRTGLSWITVKNHIEKMHKYGTLDIKKTTRRTYISINPYYLKKLREKRGY